MRTTLVVICLLYGSFFGTAQSPDLIPFAAENFSSLATGTDLSQKTHPSYYKYQIAQSVFNKLVEARGSLELPIPGFEMKSQKLYVAYLKPISGIIGLEEPAYDLCVSFGPDSLNALASLLAHELTHYFEKHSWTRHFVKSSGDLTVSDDLSQVNIFTHNETQADHLGGMLAYTAGFEPYEIMPRLLEKVYEAYGFSPELPGYPSLPDRISISKQVQHELQNLMVIYKTAQLLTAIGDYYGARMHYLQLVKEYHSREIYHNLGVLTVLEMIDYFPPDYAYPVELDATSRLDGSKRGGPPTVEKAALVKESIDWFNRALAADHNYPLVYQNLACVYALSGDLRRARFFAEEVEIMGLYDEAQLLFGLIAAEKGENSNAATFFKASGHPLAGRNTAILEGRDYLEEFAARGPLQGVNETLDDVSLDVLIRKLEPDTELDILQKAKLYQQSFEHSEALIANFGNGTLAIFQSTMPDCNDQTARGIQLGQTQAEVLQAYGDPDAFIRTNTGSFLRYQKDQILFRLNDSGHLTSWTVYRSRSRN